MSEEVRSGLIQDVRDLDPRGAASLPGDHKDGGSMAPGEKKGDESETGDADGTDGGDTDAADKADSDGTDGGGDADGTDGSDADGTDNA